MKKSKWVTASPVPREDEADIGRSLDFIQLCAVRVRYGEDQPVFTIGPWLHRSRPQSARALRRQHAHADVFNDVPDAVNAALFAHAAAHGWSGKVELPATILHWCRVQELIVALSRSKQMI